MTRIQLNKDDLTKLQIEGIMGLEEDENFQDWDIQESEEYIIMELDDEDGESMIIYLKEDLGIEEDAIELE